MIITNPVLLLAANSAAATTSGAEMTINTTTKTIKLNPGTAGSDLPELSDGVTFQALYSAMKILWKNSSTLIKFPFPFISITPEQYEVINGWSFLDTTTRKAIRTAGWSERNTDGDITAMYAGIISLGTLGAEDQPYFTQGGSSTNFAFTGPVNEAVIILSDPNGDGNYTDGFDRRSNFRIFAREEQKTYASATLADIGVTSMDTITYRFPLTNSTDLKALVDDTALEADTTYDNIDITWNGSNVQKTIGGSSYNFSIIIDGDGKTAEQIYTKVQYLLRQNSDIDTGAGTVVGKTADALLRFVGDNLVTSQGVYIDNFNSNDTNRIEFYDVTNNRRQFPFVASGNLVFNANLVSDPDSVYTMYFTSTPSGSYGSSTAIITNNAVGTPIAGSVSSGSIPFTFSYDSNVQGGRTAATDVDVTVVAIGLSTGQFVSTTATISRTNGQTIALTAPLERNFSS